MIVAGMLETARRADDGEPLFLVKGGVAMELRMDAGARATKDLDTAFRESIDAITAHLDRRSEPAMESSLPLGRNSRRSRTRAHFVVTSSWPTGPSRW